MDYNKLLGIRRKTGQSKIRQFHGINQAVDESDLAAAAASEGCYTPKGVNFWIKNGNLTVRNNYERACIGGLATGTQITSITADMADAYTYKIKSLWAYTPAASDIYISNGVDTATNGTAYLLAGVDALLNGSHHHFCLVHRLRDTADTWKEVTNSGKHSLGDILTDAGKPVWFYNADFIFANYSGDFYETDTEYFATIISNGADMPMFYTPAGLSVLGSSGWLDVMADAATNQFTTASAGFSMDDVVEVHSRTQVMPTLTAGGALLSNHSYFVVNRVGSTATFQLSGAKGGATIDLSGNGANLVIHMKVNYGAWAAVKVDHTAQKITNISSESYADGMQIQFNGSVASGSLPTGIDKYATYVIVNTAGKAFQLTCPTSKTPLAIVQFTSDGKNVQVRTVKGNPADAPRGRNIMVYSDRLWMNVGDKIYYSAGVYDNPSTGAIKTLARPNDWSNSVYAGNVAEPSWDGETLSVMKMVNGKPFIAKSHNLYAVDGAAPPFTFRQITNGRGTTAPKSVCWHISGGVFEVVPEGILVYNGTSTAPYVSLEIQNIWKADAHAGAIGAVVGDLLYVYGSYRRPDTGYTENGMIVINITTKDICYWDMAFGGSLLTVDAVLDPRLTMTASNSIPQFWFACGDAIYRVSASTPAAGAAVPMVYFLPENDFGDASVQKHVSKVTITGSGGNLTVTPAQDGTDKPAKVLALPAKPTMIQVQGRRIKLKLASTSDPVVVRDIEQIYS